MRTQSTNFQTVGSWLGRIFRLDFSAFGEIRADPSATSAAVMVVFGASLMAGLGSWIWALQHSFVDSTDVFVRSFILGSILQTAVWFLWVYMVYLVLSNFYSSRLEFGELIRAMGFAFAPFAFSVLVLLAVLAVPFGMISVMMAVLFTNAAIQQVSDADVNEATVANVAGFCVFAIVMGGCANIFEVDGIGGLAPGIFFFSLDL